MRIVFLDIDGVLNNARSDFLNLGPTLVTSEKVRALARLDEDEKDQTADFESWVEPGVLSSLKRIDSMCVALINKLLENCDGLVLSSSHRRFFANSKVKFGSQEHLRRLRMYLDASEIKIPAFFDITGIKALTRSDQINDWLNRFEHRDNTRYVVIDDDQTACLGQIDYFVHVNSRHGFSFNDYAKCCQILELHYPKYS